MAVDVFGYRVDDNISAVVKRGLEVRAEESVVDYDENAVLMCDGSDGADVDKAECRVGRAFDPDELRLWSNELCNVKLDAW